ncbi:methylmalonyl-CoA mutase subunit beta [Jejudonia soesokkakensis]|uniref:Methylmalonyl-CoA mutase subunit beta n=1 Tax=Jejudonia soesokkakensis TaxID=1323432 RepID=A0ABW2MWL0_9FLAO
MSSQLFNEFEPVSAKQWKQKIQVDLKGADYNDTLIWQSLEGIHVKPFYHRDDFNEAFKPIPGQPTDWKIGQHIFIDDETIANSLALDAIERGAEAIYFSSESEFDVKKVFQNFPFSKVPVYFDFSFLAEAFSLQLNQFLSEKNATVFYNIDLIGTLGTTGNWFHNLKEDHSILETILKQSPSENILQINTSTYQNAGANCMQQLAYALAHVNEYLNHFSENKELKITFKISVGGNYFFEIAKIRALRILYAALASEYGMPTDCHIVATPSLRNKTLYDYNVNMLRTTTECMSAVLGGADTIANLAYDGLYHKSNEFGERISRNQLLILKAESYFDMVSNPADGSYYIESLTQELTEKALALFKNIEAGGGFLHQLKEGIIQKKIKESAAKEQALFDEGKLKLVGTNYHINKNDVMKHELELYPFVKIKNHKTLLAPIVPVRLSEKIEKERIENE